MSICRTLKVHIGGCMLIDFHSSDWSVDFICLCGNQIYRKIAVERGQVGVIHCEFCIQFGQKWYKRDQIFAGNIVYFESNQSSVGKLLHTNINIKKKQSLPTAPIYNHGCHFSNGSIAFACQGNHCTQNVYLWLWCLFGRPPWWAPSSTWPRTLWAPTISTCCSPWVSSAHDSMAARTLPAPVTSSPCSGVTHQLFSWQFTAAREAMTC